MPHTVHRNYYELLLMWDENQYNPLGAGFHFGRFLGNTDFFFLTLSRVCEANMINQMC